MASSPPDFALVIHSPDKDMVTELIEKHKDKTIILACKTNNDCNYFYDNIRSFKDIIRIIRKKDCEKIKKTQQETFESEEELITITCCDCYGKSRELSEDFETQCDYILDSSNSTEYKKRFKEIQKKNKYICPYRINVKLLEKKKNPLIITTHYGLQFYTFLEEFVKDAIIIINDANSIKDVCKEEYVLSKNVKKGQKNKDLIDKYVKERTVIHLDLPEFLKIGFTEDWVKIQSGLIDNIGKIITQEDKRKEYGKMHMPIKEILEKIRKNLEQTKDKEAYYAYTIFRAFTFLEDILNPRNNVEIIRSKKGKNTQCVLMIRRMVEPESEIEERVTNKLTQARKTYLLESYPPDRKYYPFYYGVRPKIINTKTEKKLEILFIGGKSNLKYVWGNSKNISKLISSIRTIRMFSIGKNYNPLFIVRNKKEKEEIEKKLAPHQTINIVHSKGFISGYKQTSCLPISIGIPFPDRASELKRIKTVSRMCGFKADFEDYYRDAGLTGFMNNVAFNLGRCKYAVALNVKTQGIETRIKKNMLWTKKVKFVQISGILERTEDIGFKILQYVEGEENPLGVTESRIRNAILHYAFENGRICAKDLNKLIGNKGTKTIIFHKLKKERKLKLDGKSKKPKYYIKPEFQPPY